MPWQKIRAQQKSEHGGGCKVAVSGTIIQERRNVKVRVKPHSKLCDAGSRSSELSRALIVEVKGAVRSNSFRSHFPEPERAAPLRSR